jgi:hypothetical protein
MEDLSSFGREMIFHPRADGARPPRFTWRNLLGSSKLDLKQSPPTLLARFVGHLNGFLGSSAKEKAKAGHESGTVVSVSAIYISSYFRAASNPSIIIKAMRSVTSEASVCAPV